MKPKKVAIVYDWIDKWGGVERVLLTFAQMFPDADFFTSYYDEKEAVWARSLKIKTSFIQKFPYFIRKSRLLSFFFYPYAFESFNFSAYDLVISVSSSFAKSIITRPETKHICYLLTPTRYIWVESQTYLKGIKRIGKLFLPKMREWDYVAAQRPDKIVSISNDVAQRSRKFYNRESEVIYPPFDISYWTEVKSKIRLIRPRINSHFNVLSSKFYLVVSRLEPYKKVDLAINVFNKLPHLNLIIVGQGSEMNKLKAIANDNTTFLCDLTDEELGSLYKKAEALIMPQREEFGYVSLEAQFFGCPVIAYRAGGAIETVLENETGIFFEEQATKSLKAAIDKFSNVAIEIRKSILKNGKKNLEKFSKKVFIDKFSTFIYNSDIYANRRG